MPDILSLAIPRWSLTVWTRDNVSPLQTLTAVLGKRGKSLPPGIIRFSLPFITTDGESSSQHLCPHPLLYENREYEFEFIFPAGSMPDEKKPIIHPLHEIEDGFRCIGNTVRGRINFKNHVGWFRLGIRYQSDGRAVTESLSFQVFPTKMDMVSDLEKILQEIDAVYPLWRFSVVQKTDDELARSRKKHEHFELLWLAQFKALQKELAQAVKLVCRSPHSRLVTEIKSVKAERLKGRLRGKLEESIAENFKSKNYDKQYSIEKKRLSFDTPVNRFVKTVVANSVSRIGRFSRNLSLNEQNRITGSPGRLSQSFFESLAELKKPFERLSNEQLFLEIGVYEGHLSESLVLHQRMGYAKIYRIWQELKLYLDFFGSDTSVSQRSVEQLYEIWCVLELKRILEQLGFEEINHAKNPQTKTYEKVLSLTDGLFRFSRSDGLTGRLIHEPSYSSPSSELDKIYSWTTNQRPDILLEMTLADGVTARWAFDAKYRIDSNSDKTWPEKNIDRVPDDAINQMHRYRDALIYLSKAEDDCEAEKSRPIIGAFALYPGWFENQADRENPYKDSIGSVGIGAFPLLPGQPSLWLEQFLKEKLGATSGLKPYPPLESDDLYLQESVRIAPYGLKQYRHRDLVLAVGIYKTTPGDYCQPFVEGTAKYYHMPVNTTDGCRISRYIMRELGYCAFSVKDADRRICRYLYPVKSICIKKRFELNEIAGGPNPEKAQLNYWVIELGHGELIHEQKDESSRKFKTRIVDLVQFRSVEAWDELQVQRYKKVFPAQ